MDFHSDRTLLVCCSFLVLLSLVIGLGRFASDGMDGGTVLLLAFTFIIIIAVMYGVLVFLDRYPANTASPGNAIYWMMGFLAMILLGEIYYLICRYFLGQSGSVDKFGALGDSFGPLASIFTGLTLLLEVLTSRSQSLVQEKQQTQIDQQTKAWTEQAQHQQSQAKELIKNNELYRHMILVQRISTATVIRTRLAELCMNQERIQRKAQIQKKTKNGTAPPHNYPSNSRLVYEIDHLKTLFAVEVAVISRIANEIDSLLTDEERTQIRRLQDAIN